MRHAWRREVRGLVWGCLSYFSRGLGVCLLVGNQPTSMEVLQVHNAGGGGGVVSNSLLTARLTQCAYNDSINGH